MSVIVKGMRMPTTCAMCDLAHAMKTRDGLAKLACGATGKWEDEYRRRPSWCPLVELTEEDTIKLSFQNWESKEAGELRFGDRLYSALAKRQMTQRELAKRIGVTEVTISRYISNHRMPHAAMIVKIAETLGMSADTLLGTGETEKHHEG